MACLKYKAEKSVTIPSYQSSGSSGMDVCAHIEKSITLEPGKAEAIPTGLFLEIPEGYEVQVRSRSGLALKNNVFVLNSPGTIDSDYRGEVKIILFNLSETPFIINNGERIAQLVLCKCEKAELVRSDSLSDTERGCGGFGSTGV